MGGAEAQGEPGKACTSGKGGHAQSQPEPRAYQTEKIASRQVAEIGAN